MNLENLKKTALERSSQALKKIIDANPAKGKKDAEDTPVPDTDTETIDTATDEEFDDFLDSMSKENLSDEEPSLGKTQKFNIQDILNKIRNKGEHSQDSGEDVSESDTEEQENINDDSDPQLIYSAEAIDIDQTLSSVDNNINNAIKISEKIEATSEELKSSIEEFQTSINDRIDKIEAQLAALSNDDQSVSELKVELEKHINSNASSTAAINGKLSSIESKLSDISNSLSGISKLNDSIFDLKNAQMNSKNSIEELVSSFITLKKKCVAGVIILSIVSILVLIAEVVNLLS